MAGTTGTSDATEGEAVGDDRRVEQNTQPEPLAAAPAWPVGTPGTAGGEISPPDERPGPRSMLLAGGMLLSSILLAVLVVLPAPYAVTMPGPTRDVLGEHEGTPLIRITGAETFDSSGELRLTTVSATGGPGFPTSVAGAVRGWLSTDTVVLPVEQVVPSGQTQEEIDAENSSQMTSSQENATVAALTWLGYEVPAVLTVAEAVEGTGAEGTVEEGDVVRTLDGTPVPDYQTLVAGLAAVEPGATITLGVVRDGERLEVQVVTGARPDGGGALIGILVDPAFEFPVDVQISIDDVGGPSAGTMFALGIVDLLTPQDEANGAHIAGTGSIEVTGDVLPIGGIRQKMLGAVRDGAQWFLAPEANCDEVVGHVPDGLRVVRIASLDDAVEAMTAIGAGGGAALPACGS